MSNLIQNFNSQEFGNILTIELDGDIWFLGKDIATILGYALPTKAIQDRVDNEDRKCLTYKAFSKMEKALWSNNDFSDKWVINESGLYSLILGSKLPSAKRFKHWVTKEVIPSIRKTGSYGIPSLPSNYIEALEALVKSEKEKEAQRLQLEMQRPKVEYFDNLVDRKLLTNFRDTAKELGMKQNDFVKWLLDNGYVYRDACKALKPYAQYTPSLFEMKDFNSRTSDHTGVRTFITVKGKETFKLLLNK